MQIDRIFSACFPGSSYDACCTQRHAVRDMPRGMEQRMTALERAFRRPRSRRVAGLTDIITSLRRDGYSASQIEGPLLARQAGRFDLKLRAPAVLLALPEVAGAA